MEHKHLIVRAEIEKAPTDEAAVQEWVMKLGSGVPNTGSSSEGIYSVLVGDDNMVAARFWHSEPILLQLDVCASIITPTDIFDLIEPFGVLTKSFMFLNRTNSIQQIF